MVRFLLASLLGKIYLEKLELFTGRFYPIIPNKGHNCFKSCIKKFEFSTLGATPQNSHFAGFFLSVINHSLFKTTLHNQGCNEMTER